MQIKNKNLFVLFESLVRGVRIIFNGKNYITDSDAGVEILGNSDILDGQSREIVKNRKPTVSSRLPGHQQARESSSTLSVIIANNQEVSSPPVDTLSQPATPTAHPSYQLLCRYCNGKNFVKRKHFPFKHSQFEAMQNQLNFKILDLAII